MLENVCLSKQRRDEYQGRKAKNLTTRLGTYNKNCEHKVVYYK